MRLLIGLMIGLFSLAAYADTAPDEKRGSISSCKSVRMCDAQTVGGAGDCDDVGDGTGVVIVHSIQNKSVLSFNSEASAAADYSCTVCENIDGHDATTGDCKDAGLSAITDEAPILKVVGLFTQIWVTCGTITDNTVTIDLLNCPAER